MVVGLEVRENVPLGCSGGRKMCYRGNNWNRKVCDCLHNHALTSTLWTHHLAIFIARHTLKRRHNPSHSLFGMSAPAMIPPSIFTLCQRISSHEDLRPLASWQSLLAMLQALPTPLTGDELNAPWWAPLAECTSSAFTANDPQSKSRVIYLRIDW